MSGLLEDLRDALRQIRRRPLQTLATVLVMAIGLSAGIAAFTYLNEFSRPFPGVDSDGLIRLFGVEPNSEYAGLPYLDVLDYTEAGAFQDIAIAQPFYGASVRLQRMTELGWVEAVSGNFFPLAGVEIAEGRGLAEADDHLEADPAAVISWEWWQTLFGGQRSVLGSTIYLNYRPFTVVGVASPDFLGTTSAFRPDVWIPIAHFRDRYTSFDVAARDRDIPIARAYGRLRPGENRERAMTRLLAVARGLDETAPREAGPRRLRLEDATWIDAQTREAERATVRVMLGAAIGLLLLVCANVANLLLALAAERRRETATRAALGASPGRLLRGQLVTNAVVSLAAGAIGLALAGPLTARLGGYFARPSVWGEYVPRSVAIDPRVLWFSLGIALLTGLLAGLAPGLRASRTDIVSTLKTGAGALPRGRRGLARLRIRGATDLLVTTQVALSVVLLTVAGLVLRTLRSVEAIDPGFPHARMIASHVSTSSTDLDPSERGGFFHELERALEAEPWVERVAIAENAMLSGQRRRDYLVDGQSDNATLSTTRLVPGFFADFGVSIVAGRAFSPGDSASAPDVAIVNETFSDRFFGDEPAVGRRVTLLPPGGGEPRPFEIVGVAADYRIRDVLIEPEPVVYLSYPQEVWTTGSALHVTTTGDPEAAVPLLQRWLRSYESYLAIINVISYREVVRGSFYAQRMNAELFSVLASLALILAAVGLFAVLSLAVRRRTREIGIRMAVGAGRGGVRRLVVGRALVPVGLGLVIGISFSLAGSGLVRGLLFGVEPTDPLALAGGLAVLLAAALAAAWVPARRATHIDPMEALRPDG